MASTEPRFRITELLLVKPGTVPNQFVALTDTERGALSKSQSFTVLGKLSGLAPLTDIGQQLRIILRKDDVSFGLIPTGGLTATPGPLGLMGTTTTYDFAITIATPTPPPPPQMPPLLPEFAATPFFLQVFYHFPANTPVPLSTECVTGKFV